jgi:hypothetical protein
MSVETALGNRLDVISNMISNQCRCHANNVAGASTLSDFVRSSLSNDDSGENDRRDGSDDVIPNVTIVTNDTTDI